MEDRELARFSDIQKYGDKTYTVPNSRIKVSMIVASVMVLLLIVYLIFTGWLLYSLDHVADMVVCSVLPSSGSC